jgi:hypothetical protein
MPGIRIHHPTLSNCTLVVPHPGGDERRPKDYNIRLDNDGNTIVSETIWQRLNEARLNGFSAHQFIVLNEVADPPTQYVDFGKPPEYQRMFKQIQDAITELTPQGVKPRIVRA